jgi:hypothetical protein
MYLLAFAVYRNQDILHVTTSLGDNAFTLDCIIIIPQDTKQNRLVMLMTCETTARLESQTVMSEFQQWRNKMKLPCCYRPLKPYLRAQQCHAASDCAAE